jgi:cyanate permease
MLRHNSSKENAIKVSDQYRSLHISKTYGTGLEKTLAYRYVIAGLIAFLAYSAGLSLLAIGPIAPLIIADYGIKNSTAGLLTSISFLVHIPFAIPISMLIGRMGPKKLIFLGGVAGAAPLLSFMAADSFLLLLGLRAVYGMSFLFLFAAVGPLFMQWFPPKELPLANGIFLLSSSLGITTATFVVAPLSEAIGWELVLSGFGGVSLLSALAWLSLGKAQRIHREDNETRPLIALVWSVLRSRTTLLVAVADAGPLTLLNASMAWLPTLYHEVHAISLTEAGVYMGTLSMAGLIALILASLLTARTRKRRPFLIIPGILAGFAGFAVLWLPDSVALYIAVSILGFVCWFYLPALLTIPMDMYPNDPRRVSLISATLLSIGGIATAIAPPTIGAIADLTGSFIPGLAACAVLGWTLAIAGMFMPTTPATLDPPNNLLSGRYVGVKSDSQDLFKNPEVRDEYE